MTDSMYYVEFNQMCNGLYVEISDPRTEPNYHPSGNDITMVVTLEGLNRFLATLPTAVGEIQLNMGVNGYEMVDVDPAIQHIITAIGNTHFRAGILYVSGWTDPDKAKALMPFLATGPQALMGLTFKDPGETVRTFNALKGIWRLDTEFFKENLYNDAPEQASMNKRGRS